MKRILSVFALSLAIPVWGAPQDFVKKPASGVNIDPGIKHSGPKHPDEKMPFVKPMPTKVPTLRDREKAARRRAEMNRQLFLGQKRARTKSQTKSRIAPTKPAHKTR